MECTDIDECAAPDHGGCSSDAMCMNSPGGRMCTCKPGFEDVSGDGTQCVNKCETAGCDPMASCKLMGDKAVCACMPPFIGDGRYLHERCPAYPVQLHVQTELHRKREAVHPDRSVQDDAVRYERDLQTFRCEPNVQLRRSFRESREQLRRRQVRRLPVSVQREMREHVERPRMHLSEAAHG